MKIIKTNISMNILAKIIRNTKPMSLRFFAQKINVRKAYLRYGIVERIAIDNSVKFRSIIRVALMLTFCLFVSQQTFWRSGTLRKTPGNGKLSSLATKILKTIISNFFKFILQ
jgi:hypothetical protein